jgi:hypothetical protein
MVLLLQDLLGIWLSGMEDIHMSVCWFCSPRILLKRSITIYVVVLFLVGWARFHFQCRKFVSIHYVYDEVSAIGLVLCCCRIWLSKMKDIWLWKSQALTCTSGSRAWALCLSATAYNWCSFALVISLLSSLSSNQLRFPGLIASQAWNCYSLEGGRWMLELKWRDAAIPN